jgi:hypothetical protein
MRFSPRKTPSKDSAFCLFTNPVDEGTAQAVALPKLYIMRSPKLCEEDIKKSARDAKAPPYQPRNANHVNHRTDSDGNVTFDDETAIENAEEWARMKAVKERLELEPDTDVDTFFVKGSTERKVYSFKTDPTFTKVTNRSQKA